MCLVTVLVVLVFWHSDRKIRQSDKKVFGGVMRGKNSILVQPMWRTYYGGGGGRGRSTV